MNNIIMKQNLQENIDRLAAQRHLYTIAKHYSVWIFVLCVIMPVLLSILKISFSSEAWIAKVLVVASFLITFVKMALGNKKEGFQNLASRIQQMFDCDLFSLPWNEALCGRMPLPEEVYKYKQGAETSKLSNWYEKEIEILSPENGALVCMRTNVIYDQSIRLCYLNVCTLMATVASLIVFIIGLLSDTTFWDLFIYGIVPLMPIVVWYIDTRNQHKKNIKALGKLQTLITGCIKNAEHGNPVTKEELMTIQNFMFIHRSTSYIIPDIVYWRKRNEAEKATSYSIHHICEKLR